MKEKIAGVIVRRRIVIFIAAVILAAVCAPLIARTRVNYDLTRYLSKDTMTRRALTVMQEEFGSTEQLRVMFHDLDAGALAGYTERMQALPQVQLAVHDPREDVRERDGVIYQQVTLTLNECDAAALVEELRDMFPEEDYAVGGSVAAQLDVQKSLGYEIPLALLLAVAVVIAVLLLTSRAWLEPAVIMAVLVLSILINMGTNLIFPDVSFITFAVCAILQLALSIDYAIMLLHAWNDRVTAGQDAESAMVDALAASFMPIASSAMTTAAGLLSLLFMSFTIGFDIGLVLSKGILISMLGVFLLMPALTLFCRKGLRRTAHKPLRLGGARLARGIYRFRRPIAAVLTVAAAAAFFLQNANTYTFTEHKYSTMTETDQVVSLFGSVDPLVLMVPGGDSDADYDRQRALTDELEKLTVDGQPALDSISAMVTTGADALKYYTADEAAALTGQSPLAIRGFYLLNGYGEKVRGDRLLQDAEKLLPDNAQIRELGQALNVARAVFLGKNYTRMLLIMHFASGDPQAPETIERIMEIGRAHYGNDVYLTGIPMSVYDIAAAFRGDLLRVNLITLAAIFLIVAFSFRRVGLAAVLVFVIEGAIWIGMAVSKLKNQPIFFMCYLILVAIQMGATIDYAILFTQQYRTEKKKGGEARQALAAAYDRALPTVLTSGIILIMAGYVIGRLCTVYYISSIGMLLSRGAAVSVILVLTLLPALLTVRDGLKERRK
ncbi:MAG: MMPL family transporter [Clostridiales bacterium]|nr:MMPL family transporter [Clostridiales bacterium]